MYISMIRITRRSVSLLWLAFLPGGQVFATQPTPPTIDARLEVTVPQNVEVNVPFAVTFTLETLEELRTQADKPQHAWISAPDNAVYVGGDTTWVGLLTVGSVVSISATYRITKPDQGRFHGLLESHVGRVAADGKYVLRRHLNGTSSELMSFPSAVPIEPATILEILDSGVSVSRKELSIPAPKPRLPVKKITFNGSDTQPSGLSKIDSEKDAVSHTVQPVQIDLRSKDSVIMRVPEAHEVTFITNDEFAKLDLRLIRGEAMFRKTGHLKGVFVLECDTACFEAKAGDVVRVLMLVKQVR